MGRTVGALPATWSCLASLAVELAID